MVENTCPILRVEDLSQSVAYYVDILGFQVSWQDEYSAGVCRDKGSIMLILGSQGCSGTYVWVGVQDVDSFYDEIRQRGARVRHAPENYPWALEMKVEDPDGHVLRIGSNPRLDEPFVPFSL